MWCSSGYVAGCGLVVGGAEVAEAGVPAAGVVPALDVFEYGLPGGGVRRPRLAVQQLGLDRGEEGFGDRVVPTLPAPAHRQADPVLGGEAGVLGAGVLTPRDRNGTPARTRAGGG